MRILNFGSLNVDHVYSVSHFVRPGETLDSAGYQRFCGGKGLNQSIALAHADARVYHAGKVGGDGAWLKDRLERAGANTRYVQVADGPSGHAIIQVCPDGENAILLHGGANRRIVKDDVAAVVGRFSAGDFILLQNEISAIPEIMRQADALGMQIVFNPAPMNRAVRRYPLGKVRWFILNEVEAHDLTGERRADRALAAMRSRFPRASVVLTLGSRGAVAASGGSVVRVPAAKVRAVDTTAAGDTFIGYFLAEIAAGRGLEAALRMACRAAAICVTRRGAADSIPRRRDLR